MLDKATNRCCIFLHPLKKRITSDSENKINAV